MLDKKHFHVPNGLFIAMNGVLGLFAISRRWYYSLKAEISDIDAKNKELEKKYNHLSELYEAINSDIERFYKTKQEFDESMQSLDSKNDEMKRDWEREVHLQQSALGNTIERGLKNITKKSDEVNSRLKQNVDESIQLLTDSHANVNATVQASLKDLKAVYSRLIKAKRELDIQIQA